MGTTKPLSRTHFASDIDERPLVILRNNSLYLTRALLDRIGNPRCVRVRTEGGRVVVAPAESAGKQGRRRTGAYTLAMNARGGGWVSPAHWIIREVFGGDITVAIDYALQPVEARS